MAPNVSLLRVSQTNKSYKSLAARKIAQTLTAVTLLTVFSVAQDSTQVAAAPGSTIAIPAGSRIALVLTQPIQTRYVHRGDDVYAQVVSPVTAGNQVVIPAGTFVQGKIDRIERQGVRGDVRLQSMSISFPDGYTLPIVGPITLDSPDGYAWKDPGGKRGGAALGFAAGGAGAGALIGHFAANSQSTTITNTLPPNCGVPTPGCMNPTSQSLTIPGSSAKGTIIGAAVGGAVGAVVSIALLTTTHNFFIDAGAPVEMVLQQPLTLKLDEVATAVQQSEEHPVAQQPITPRAQYYPPGNYNPGICWTPGMPGTPDTDIPGTPAMGDSPGTPSIHIPGIPPTPPTAHPCP